MAKYYNVSLTESRERVLSADKKNSFLHIVLEDTVFYPGGGGQPSDTGTMETGSFKGEVVSAYKENGKIVHKVKPCKGIIEKGDIALVKINKERRKKLTLMHTGEHILFKALEAILKDARLDKISLEEDESSLFIISKSLSWEDLFKAEDLANSIISMGLPIIEKQYTKEEAVKLKGLRIKPERIKSDKIRVIEIKGYDLSACTGLHCSSTNEVKSLLITKFSLNKGKWEIKFKADAKKSLFALSRAARQAASLLQANNDNINKIIGAIKKLQDEKEHYKKRFREISSMLLDYYTEEEIGNIRLIYNIVEGLEKKQLIDKSAEIIKKSQDKKAAACFINKIGDRAIVVLSASPGIDSPNLLKKALSKFNGKGGGKNNFAMGSIGIDNFDYKSISDNFIKELKKLIDNGQ